MDELKFIFEIIGFCFLCGFGLKTGFNAAVSKKDAANQAKMQFGQYRMNREIEIQDRMDRFFLTHNRDDYDIIGEAVIPKKGTKIISSCSEAKEVQS